MKKIILMILTCLGVTANTFAQDPNFYIFLCFGQSNMEGAARIEPQDLRVSAHAFF